MLKSIAFLFALLFAATAGAQTTAPLDSFVTKSGVVHKGILMENNYPEFFRFRTVEDYVLKVPFNIVGNYYFGPSTPARQSAAMPAKPFNIPAYLISKRNTGIVLTSIGVAAFTTGVALMAASPADRQTYSNSRGAGIRFTGKAAGGFVAAFLSPAFFITGSIIWAKASSRIRAHKIQAKKPKDF
ncbi:MAG TPA: hypothetical protein VK174_09170 [Chitinophagales bacterium]|nr:hypothetical protein [Chitinophagales bacterium]